MQGGISSKEIREQVISQIADFMAEAQSSGLEPFSAAKRAFPGTPEGVLGEAIAEMWGREEEAWWQTVEKTIDGEVIKKALLIAGDGGGNEA